MNRLKREFVFNNLKGPAALAQSCLLGLVICNAFVRLGLAMVGDWGDSLLMPSLGPMPAMIAGVAGLVGIILWICTPPAFLCWVVDAQQNIHHLKVPNYKIPPNVSVILWLIPVVNLMAPYFDLVALYKASNPLCGDDWRKSKAPPLIFAWWLCWLWISTGFCIGLWMAHSVTTIMLLKAFGIADMAANVIGSLIDVIVFTTGGLLLHRLIGVISANQRTKYHMLVAHKQHQTAISEAPVADSQGCILNAATLTHELEH